ncbi:MAG: CBU_0592 family membrane protein [Terriglobales bacterium]
MNEAFQLLGAILVLIAFGLSQIGSMKPHSYSYLLLNLVGSGLLAVSAAVLLQWGFLLMEGVWAAVSLTSLLRRLLARAAVG